MDDREHLYQKCAEAYEAVWRADDSEPVGRHAASFRRAIDTSYEAGLIDGIRMGTDAALRTAAQSLRDKAPNFGEYDESLVRQIADVIERSSVLIGEQLRKET